MKGSKSKIRVLVTSAGSTNGVNVIKALRRQKEIGLFLVAADMDPLAAGFFMADKHYLVPAARARNFIPGLLRICRKERIKIIIPTFSSELPELARKKSIFEKRGIKMAISSYKTLLETENKIKTNSCFKGWGIPFPRSYTEKEIKNGRVRFPVIVKPIEASGSKGVFRANNRRELEFFRNYLKKSFVQECARGKEYTVDGVCGLKGKMIAALPRVRLATRGGLAVKSVTVKDPLMVALTRKIVEGFGIVGPFNVQCFKEGKSLKFIEVNSRFPSGGLPLAVGAGLNIPLILVKLLLGKKPGKPELRAGLAITRYWDAVILKKVNRKYRPL